MSECLPEYASEVADITGPDSGIATGCRHRRSRGTCGVAALPEVVLVSNRCEIISTGHGSDKPVDPKLSRQTTAEESHESEDHRHCFGRRQPARTGWRHGVGRRCSGQGKVFG